MIWVEEKKVIGMLEDIVEKVIEVGIMKMVFIMVGDFFGEEFYYFKLYDKDFKYEYR